MEKKMAHIKLPEFEEIDTLKEMGWSDVQIIESVAVIGYFNYINTLSNVFGWVNKNVEG